MIDAAHVNALYDMIVTDNDTGVGNRVVFNLVVDKDKICLDQFAPGNMKTKEEKLQ